MGSKDRVMPCIDSNLDKSKKLFVDAFCGSGVVGVNVAPYYTSVVLNDACWQMSETLNYFEKSDINDILESIDGVIEEFKLSKENKDGYDRLRDVYNTYYSQKESFQPVIFYCLVTHAFNYNIHINKSGGFSVPFGKNRSSFNRSLRKKLMNFQATLNTNKNKVTVTTSSYKELLHTFEPYLKDCMVYLDPPYLSSDSSYGRIAYLGKWDEMKERELCETLDYINEMGGSFLLSNVLKNNGKENEILKEWSSRYSVIDVSADYANCNYQRKNLGKTQEVLIRNY